MREVQRQGRIQHLPSLRDGVGCKRKALTVLPQGSVETFDVVVSVSVRSGYTSTASVLPGFSTFTILA